MSYSSSNYIGVVIVKMITIRLRKLRHNLISLNPFIALSPLCYDSLKGFKDVNFMMKALLPFVIASKTGYGKGSDDH
jgi:hypothetical protein